ncbi:hypothetical protein Hte_005330 [Hypoxylon texense]
MGMGSKTLDLETFRFLETEGDSRNSAVARLRSFDPSDDKRRIEDAKGGLLREAYSWIFEKEDFTQWLLGPTNGLLWVRGDPGKGKTMLLCGIIDELEDRKRTDKATSLVAFFFCQATDSRLNNATAVLRGLISHLINQQQSLDSHVTKKYENAGEALFQGINAWFALRQIFESILGEPSLPQIIVVIDALDECENDLERLLDLITGESRVKWIVSSRNHLEIEGQLHSSTQHVGPLFLELCLEDNKASISAAVNRYIQHKVDRLAKRKSYPDEMRDYVQTYLSSKSNDTFLWVALVCEALADSKVRLRHTQAKLKSFPAGLGPLYRRMIDQIENSTDAVSCRQILGVVSIVYRPLSLQELALFVGSPEDLEELIKLCGSFLVLQEGSVSFIHQSAKDYLLQNAKDMRNEHPTIFRKSLEAMSQYLRRNVYDLNDWSIPPNQIQPQAPDPLVAVRYSCVYWVEHLAESQHGSLQDGEMVDRFLREHYLHWLEALSIMNSLPHGVLAMSKLKELTVGETPGLSDLVQDAYRFIRLNMPAIETSPLQVYASALLFSPRQSLVRNLFKEERHPWLPLEPAIEDQWSAAKATFVGHKYMIRSLASSLDGNRIASSSMDGKAKIWDMATGACISTLEGHDDSVESVAFSHDGRLLASGSKDHTAKIWDVVTGNCLTTLEGHGNSVRSVAFSNDGRLLASGSKDHTAKIWDVATGNCLRTLEGHSDTVISVAYSPNGELLASGSYDNTAKIWDTATGACNLTLEGHDDSVESAAFSRENTAGIAGIWNAKTGECLARKTRGSSNVMSVAFSPDGERLGTGSSYDDIQSIHFDGSRVDWESAKCITTVWDDTADCPRLATFRGYSSICAMASLPNNQVASGSIDGTVKIWDATTDATTDAISGSVEKHTNYVTGVKFSSDGSLIASIGHDYRALVWNTKTGKREETFSTDNDHGAPESVRFSTDGKSLITEHGSIPLPDWLHTGIQYDADDMQYEMQDNADEMQDDADEMEYDADEMEYDADEIQYDAEWIIYRGQKLIWLPHEYQFSSNADIHGQTIAMGCPSGRVWTLDFSNRSDRPEEDRSPYRRDRATDRVGYHSGVVRTHGFSWPA